MWRSFSISFCLLLFAVAFLAFMPMCCGEGSMKLQRVRGDFQSIQSAFNAYRIDNGFYPSTDQGFSALIARPTTAPIPEQWKQIAKRIPTDPWGGEYRYRLLDDGKGEPPFELLSSGPDGIRGNEDDLSSID
jgi:general secretion pathway protein G